MIIVICLMIVAAVLGFIAGYSYHADKIEKLKVPSGGTETYSVVNYVNGITMKDGYDMSIHTMQRYVTVDEHCGGLHISGEVDE